MAKAPKWRHIKRAKQTNAPNSKQSAFINLKDFSLKMQLQKMFASERIKAFITDMFMINMPILYLTTYVFLDGKDAFSQNQAAIFACVGLYGVILSLFIAISAQSPGYRYMGLKIIQKRVETSVDSTLPSAQNDKGDSCHTAPSYCYTECSEVSKNTESAPDSATHLSADSNEYKNLSFFMAFARYVLWIIGTSLLFGILLGLVRKDARCLHDVLTNSYVVKV